MEKGSKELEDYLALERKKVRPRLNPTAQPARSSPSRARAAAHGQTGQVFPQRPRGVAAAVWAQGSPGSLATIHQHQHLNLHLNLHVTRSRGCRSKAATLTLALHS